MRILYPGVYYELSFSYLHHPDADDKTIKEWLESNICRCTGYAEIEKAIKAVLKEK